MVNNNFFCSVDAAAIDDGNDDDKTPSWAVPLSVVGFLLAFILAALLGLLYWRYHNLRKSVHLLEPDYSYIENNGNNQNNDQDCAKASADNPTKSCDAGHQNAALSMFDFGYIDRP